MDFSDAASLIDPTDTRFNPETDEFGRPVRRHHALLGVSLTIASGLVFSLIGVSAKILDGLPISIVATLRTALLVVPSSVSLCWRRINPFACLRRSGWWLLARETMGAAATLMRIYALQNMPIGDASALLHSNPVIVAVLSWAFLGEPIGRLGAGGTVMMLGGALFISR